MLADKLPLFQESWIFWFERFMSYSPSPDLFMDHSGNSWILLWFHGTDYQIYCSYIDKGEAIMADKRSQESHRREKIIRSANKKKYQGPYNKDRERNGIIGIQRGGRLSSFPCLEDYSARLFSRLMRRMNGSPADFN